MSININNAWNTKKIARGLLPQMAAFLYLNAMTGPCAMFNCKDGPVAVNEVVVQNAQRFRPSCVEIRLRVWEVRTIPVRRKNLNAIQKVEFENVVSSCLVPYHVL